MKHRHSFVGQSYMLHRLALLGSILYDQALLVEGLSVDDPVEFARNVAKLM